MASCVVSCSYEEMFVYKNTFLRWWWFTGRLGDEKGAKELITRSREMEEHILGLNDAPPQVNALLRALLHLQTSVDICTTILALHFSCNDATMATAMKRFVV